MVVGLLAATALAACADSPQRRDEASMASAGGASNVPAPPSVDRSKCSDKGKQIVTADTNLDKKPDVWTFYEDDKIVRIERDTDFNGKVDEWQYYEGGKLDRIGYDTTGTGRLDRWDRAPEGDTGGGSSEPPTGGGAAPATTPPAAGATQPPSATASPSASAPATQTAKK
jgi:hypothetical protein